jgi:hypothetical protein
MSRSAVFYVVKAMERAAAGTTPASPPPALRRRADDHDAPETTRAHGETPSFLHRVFAAVTRRTGGTRGKAGQRRPGRALRAD